MSRGDRATVTGNLSSSMRDNYGEYGVAEYYKKVGSTYRNPHYPGIRLCIFAWLSKWWSNESLDITSRMDNTNHVLLFDMACGIGEITLAFYEWLSACKLAHATTSTEKPGPSSRKYQPYIIPIGPDFPAPLIIAADPFTSAAYQDRTSLPCASLSFNDIAEGELPPFVSNLSKIKPRAPAHPQSLQDQIEEHNNTERDRDEDPLDLPDKNEALARQEPCTSVEMVVCSFALHLVENPSALFALLCTLSCKARWLVVLAPHKKPEIKDGWGWEKWNVKEWKGANSMSSHNGEILFDRVHCRVYRSVNI
ncbi:hypothetical protein P691DRAFT_770341 [Macrolepiota fuliginosa MF-IS2]|uniref:Uncharacterized protein n=1 Tax=Macrolepiota fuliginosa MF-IS2 TaxID=1400762 RepID=A0A9P6CB86_9AGAR|nr:hypothetical protein P691DRAFT_770341 [Macrolepiota fuliginosa MF-IS2]